MGGVGVNQGNAAKGLSALERYRAGLSFIPFPRIHITICISQRFTAHLSIQDPPGTSRGKHLVLSWSHHQGKRALPLPTLLSHGAQPIAERACKITQHAACPGILGVGQCTMAVSGTLMLGLHP
ncbi:structural maintenance of chromosomes protein 4 [Platysternon megacephalum]|uniref:Structural maintenance of chromosomes protein 4 n=1 Tax=Platysternon megacephalum TaxID=55544 RepID=A0A4D9DJC6_9SAUR|nr:structural maintenance of chromosomes protein 4 [Platysternon megacephalum]